MPRSIIRRKFEAGLRKIVFSVSSASGLLRSFLTTAKIQKVKDFQLQDFPISTPPQGLQQIKRSIAVYSEIDNMKTLLSHLISDVFIISDHSLQNLVEAKEQGVESVILILTPNSTHKSHGLQSFYADNTDLPIAAYMIDEDQESLIPLFGNVVANLVSLGLFPNRDNPISIENKIAGTVVYGDPNLRPWHFRKMLSNLRPPYFRSLSQNPLEAKSVENQLLLTSPQKSPTPQNSNIKYHLASGIPLYSNHSPYILNCFPGVKSIIDGIGQCEETPLSNAWYQFLTSRLVVQAYETGTVYELLGKAIEVLHPETSSLKLWKTRILVISDDTQEEFLRTIVNQIGVNTVTLTSNDAIKLGYAHCAKNYDYITRMSNRLIYSPDYLLTKLNVFKYTSASFVTEPNQVQRRPYSPIYTAIEPDSTVSSFQIANCLDFFTLGSKKIVGSGFNDSGYGAQFCSEFHTSAVELHKKKVELSVIIPVFNNSEFLISKAIPSLLRNNSWSSMEVILVDDGSTDPGTVSYCGFLAAIFPNIRFYSFPAGGSGSASRARNKGIELSSCSRISFLDPDNEISSGGYDALLARFKKANQGTQRCDFVSGYQVKVSSNLSINGRHTYAPWPTQFKDTRGEFFDSGKFPTISTQAAIISKKLLLKKRISFVVGAVGQDTLFGWEVLLAAENPLFTNEAFLIYHSERSDSVTNKIDANYFKKSLKREKAQVHWLNKNNLFEPYLKHKYPLFLNTWYKEKFRSLPPEQQPLAATFLGQIMELYEKPKAGHFEH